MKKFIFILIGFFAFSGIASANIGNLYWGGGNWLGVYENTPILSSLATEYIYKDGQTLPFNVGTASLNGGYDFGMGDNGFYPRNYLGKFTAVYIYPENNTTCLLSSKNACMTKAGFYGAINYDVLENAFQYGPEYTSVIEPIPPINIGVGDGIFYTRTDGKSDAGLLVASVATATGETTASIGPIIAIILGIILAFIFIKAIIGLLYAPKDTKDNK
jgi:hypothetical protein